MRNRNSRIIICLAIFIFLALACACGKKSPQDIFAKATGRPTTYKLDSADQENALAIARALVEGRQPPTATANVAALCGREAWISIFKKGSQGAQGMGIGKCLPDALKDAAEHLKDHPDYKHNFKGSLDQTRIKVSITRKKQTIKKGEPLKTMGKRLEPGVYGPMLADNPRMSILPDMPVTHGWGIDRSTENEKKMRVYGKSMAKLQLGRLMKMAKLGEDAWTKMDLMRFSVYSFVEDRAGGGGRAVPLYRANHQLPFSITLDQINKAATAAGDHTLRLMNMETGKFTYVYYPDTDEISKDYNIVRHAGTVWGLFKLFNETGEKRFLDGGLRSFEYLEKSFEAPPENPDILVIREGGSAYLGTIALAALATIEMPAQFMSPERLKAQEALGNGLLALIAPDGRIYTTYEMFAAKKLPAKQPVYFPGEAALALLNLYEKTKTKKWLDGALKIADYQIGDFEKTGTPDNWIIQIMSRLYRITKNERYRTVGYKMADYNVKHQFDPERVKKMFPDYVGGFDNAVPPRTTPCGSRTEAMDEAYEMAAAAKDEEGMKRYGDAVVRGVWFMMTNQFRPENTYFLRDPDKAIGGIRGGLVANDIRINYDQHIVMALFGARAVWRDRPNMDIAEIFRSATKSGEDAEGK